MTHVPNLKPPKPIARDYLDRLTRVLAHSDAAALDHGVALVNAAWQSGRQIITMGNGGSALTALHYINDWNKSIFMASAKLHGKAIPFYGRSLCDNIGLLMSYANDVSYQDVFVEQLKNILRPGDLVIAISGSGNSENIIRGVTYANEHGAVTLGLCGYRGGKLKSLAQSVIWADIDDMQLSEDVHFIFGHMVMQSLAGMG